MAELLLKNISRTYDSSVTALSDINLSVEDGEFVVLVGPSGCGKSTLLRIIAGLESADTGEIYINNTHVNEVAPKDRDIAMVFQNYALYPHMTVFENLAFGLKMRKLKKTEIQSRVKEAAATLGLTDLLDRRPKALSGGQRQRVAVGRAIVRKPKLFLFDEPLSNLDAKLRVAMRGELIKLHKQLASTILYVTHDQTEAMSMGNRLVVLKDGLIQQVGAPLEIYNEPANLFVAGFIGSPSMNFMPCLVQEKGKDLILRSSSFTLMVPEEKKNIIKEKGFVNRDVTLGIRPENFSEQHHNEKVTKNTLILDVAFTELLGSEILATCCLGNEEILIRLHPCSSVRADDSVAFTVDMNAAKLFCPDTGEKIV